MPKKLHPFPDGVPAHIEWYRDDTRRAYVIRGGGYAVRIVLSELEADPGFQRTSRGTSLSHVGDRLPFRNLFMAALDPAFHAKWATVIERPTSKYRTRFLKHWRVTIATQRRRLKRLRPQ